MVRPNAGAIAHLLAKPNVHPIADARADLTAGPNVHPIVRPVVHSMFKRMAVLLCVASLFLLPACSSPSSPGPSDSSGPSDDSRQEPLKTERKEPSIWRELSPAVGSVGEVRQPAFALDPSELLPLLPEKAGLPEPTSVIFRHMSGLGYQYGRPGGTMEMDVRGNVHVIRYRLAEADGEGNILRTVSAGSTSGKTLRVTLPEQEPALYILSLEALAEHGAYPPIDTAFSLIEVVPQAINAELSLDRTVFRVREKSDAMLHLKNYGPQTLSFGGSYTVEQYEDGAWYRVPWPPHYGVSARGYSLGPGEVYSMDFDFPFIVSLPEGRYRAVKEVEARGVFAPDSDLPMRVHLAVEFEVVGEG